MKSLYRECEKRVFIVAEAGSNHDGDLEKAKALVRAAADSGADAVKFQAFTKDTLVASKTYAKALSISEDELAGIDAVAFPYAWYAPLKKVAKEKKVALFSTPFSVAAVAEIEKARLPFYKVASSDVQNVPLLEAIAATGKPVIISTGLAYHSDMRRAVSLFRKSEVFFLHCVVEYPAPVAASNLASLQTLASRYKRAVGLSDHSLSTMLPALAVAKGAVIIEKHFTTTPEKEGGDHGMSLSPSQFAEMVNNIRFAEEALGCEEKTFTKQEKKELRLARRGLYLTRDIDVGEKVRADDLVPLRPLVGVSASEWHDVIGKRLLKKKRVNTPLKEGDVG